MSTKGKLEESQQRLKKKQSQQVRYKRQRQSKATGKEGKATSVRELGSLKRVSRLTETASVAETCNRWGWVIERHCPAQRQTKRQTETCRTICPTSSGGTLTRAGMKWPQLRSGVIYVSDFEILHSNSRCIQVSEHLSRLIFHVGCFLDYIND